MAKNKTTRKSVWGMYDTKVVRKYPIAMLVVGIVLGYLGYGVFQKHIEVSNMITISIVVAIIVVLCSLLALLFVFDLNF